MQRALLLLLVAGAYGLLAGAPPAAVALLLALAAGAALIHPGRAWGLIRSPGARFERAMLVTAAAVALQLLPLPRQVLDILSPQAVATRRAIRLVAPESWLPLSIDAAATLLSLATLAVAAAAYLAARSILDHEGGIRRLCRLLAWFGAAAALLAVAQRGAAPGLVMGLVPPEAPGARPFGPFVNRNHFAGWLVLVMPVVAGYLTAHLRHHLADARTWHEWRRHVARSAALPLVVSLVTMVGVLLLTLSRSAVLGAGAGAVAWWLMSRRRIGAGGGAGLLAGGVLGLVLLSAALLVDLDAWAARFESAASLAGRPDSRLVIWRETLPVIADFWATGTGLGTYGEAMLAHQQSRIWVPHLAAWAHFNQAHNHYLHVLAEGGVIVAVPALVALAGLAAAARRALARDRTEIAWIRMGAAAALVGTAAQSVWEVPLVMPANAVMAALVTAILLHEPRARHESLRRIVPPALADDGRENDAGAAPRGVGP